MNSPLEQFKITKLLNIHLGWFDISITNSTLALILSILVIYLIMQNLSDKKLKPTLWTYFIEGLYYFVLNIIKEQIGKKGVPYFPFLFTLFMFVIMNNVLGMIPYNFTTTSHIVVTFTLSIGIFIGVTIIGFEKHGLAFFNLLIPSGVPLYLLPLIVIIEFISYLTRGFSLGIRLTANMFAGHTLLKIISTFSWEMLNSSNIILMVLSLIPLFLLFALTGLELVIAILQSYVFTVLTCSYLNDSLNLHH